MLWRVVRVATPRAGLSPAAGHGAADLIKDKTLFGTYTQV